MDWVRAVEAIDLVLALARHSPRVNLRSPMLDRLPGIREGADKERYAGAGLIISFFAMAFTSLLAVAIGESVLFGLLAFPLCLGIVLMLPDLESRKRDAQFIARLPVAMQSLGMLVEMNIPFQDALKIVSKDEPEFVEPVNDIERGAGVKKAFSRLILGTGSFAVKRAMSALINSYEIGGSGNEIRKIADELNSQARHSMREYSSKSAIFGLLFIMSAAVLPTFFLVYSTLGGFSIAGQVGQGEMMLAMLVVFPLISLSILLVAKSMLPHSAFGTKKSPDLKVIAPAIVMLGFILLFPSQLHVIGVVAGAGIAAWIVYSDFRTESCTEEIESHLPDALFSISSVPKSTKAEELFGIIERSGYGALSAEARKSRMQLEANLSLGMVLEDLSKRNRSSMLEKACRMLGHVFSTNSYRQLNKLASDMLNFIELKRERSGLLSMQKYTLVFGGLIVPLILKITLGLLESMAGFFNESASSQLDFAKSAIPAYIVIYALLCSVYIQDIEERRSRSAGYFLAIVIIGLATFFFLNL